jgi:hypothetical protein
MKRGTVLCLFLVLSGTALATGGGQSTQADKDFEAFWQEFKTAVVRGDKETVIGLSRFPIRMPGRVRNIKDAADLRTRYGEVFNKYVNAGKCFAEKDNEPQKDPEKPKQVSFDCDTKQADVVMSVDFLLRDYSVTIYSARSESQPSIREQMTRK